MTGILGNVRLLAALTDMSTDLKEEVCREHRIILAEVVDTSSFPYMPHLILVETLIGEILRGNHNSERTDKLKEEILGRMTRQAKPWPRE